MPLALRVHLSRKSGSRPPGGQRPCRPPAAPLPLPCRDASRGTLRTTRSRAPHARRAGGDLSRHRYSHLGPRSAGLVVRPVCRLTRRAADTLRCARVPLTPTVRRGCAAQSSALTGHCLQQSSREPTRPRLNVAGSQRCPLTSRAPFVVRQAPRRSRVFRRRIHPHPTPSTARPLRLAVPRAVADRASRSRRRVRSPRLRHNPRVRTASRHTERFAMPSFTPRAVSSSAPPRHHIHDAAPGHSSFFGVPALPQPAPLPFGHA